MELDWCQTGSPSSRKGMQELFNSNWGVRGEHRFLLLLAVPEPHPLRLKATLELQSSAVLP